MSRIISSDVKSLAENWWAIALRGVSAIIFGVLAFVLPALSLFALILMFGAYAIIEGIFNIIAAARSRSKDGPRWLLLLEGFVSIAAGIVTFALPGLTALVLVYVIAAWAMVTGVLEIIAAVRVRKQITGEVWWILSGILSVVFGVLLMIAPGAGALALVLWIGAYAVVFGALLVGLAFRLRRWQSAEQVPIARAA
jgi:uncharacterized membrane protein HdeD (DUF308 family)